MSRQVQRPAMYRGQEPVFDGHTFDICPDCKAETLRGVYAIAQKAMGHEIICTCPNGHQFAII